MDNRAAFVPILTYHGLSKKEETGADGVYTLTVHQFEMHMRYLSEGNFRVISLERVAGWLSGGFLPERAIVLTFDDGHETDFSAALPILKRFGFRASFFVNPGTLNEPGYLTEQTLRKMAGEGMEIGSHGFDHLFLTRLDEASLDDQVVGSKRKLETLLSQKVPFFSIPRGRHTPLVLERIRKAGYRLSCTSEIGMNLRTTDPYRLRRWAMRRRYSLDDFRSIVEGRPKRRLVLEHFLKESLYHVLGHTLYERGRNAFLGGVK